MRHHSYIAVVTTLLHRSLAFEGWNNDIKSALSLDLEREECVVEDVSNDAHTTGVHRHDIFPIHSAKKSCLDFSRHYRWH